MLDLVAGHGFEPWTFGLCLPLQLSLPQLRRIGLLVWTVPSPSSLTLGCLPSSLYTFLKFPLGLARDYRASDFPEFDR
jgi:hypothetical protein